MTFLGFGEIPPQLVYKARRKEDRSKWVGHGGDQSGAHGTLCWRSGSTYRGHASACPQADHRVFLLPVVLVRGLSVIW